MKKILLFTLSAMCLISCSKDELDLNEVMIQEANATYMDCATLAGQDNSINLTEAQIQAQYYSVSRLINLYGDLLGDGVSHKGVYSPSIEQLAVQYKNATNKLGAYTTTYTVTNGDCTDSTELTVNVVMECNIDAGADNTSTVLTLSQVEENYNSISKLEVLYNSLLADGVNAEGTFEPTIQEIGMRYVNAEDKTGVYSTTYTVGTGECIDSAEIAVTVVEDTVVCDVDAGADNTSVVLTLSQVEENYNSISQLEVLYNSLLADGVSAEGTFEPTIEELGMRYVNAADKTGDYTTTYTVAEGDCEDSAVINITVIEDVDNCEVNAGSDNSITLTTSQIQARYNSVSKLQILFRSLLDNDVSTAGSYSPTIEQLAVQYSKASVKTGAYTTTYTLVDGDCSDSTELTVHVIE